MSELKTLQDIFGRLSQWRADPAVVAFGEDVCRVWSFADIDTHARRLAGGMSEDNVSARAPVALMAPNSPEWIVCFWGLIAAGRTVMPLDRQMSAGERQRCLEHSGCESVFTTQEYASWFANLGIAVHLLDGAEDDPHSWRALEGDRITALPQAAPEDTACLLYTSGTTGHPKGVPLSHRNLLSNVEALLAEGIVDRGARILIPLPLHHAYPLCVGLLSGLASGAALVFPAGLGGPELMRATHEGEATVMLAVPRLYEALLDGVIARAVDGGGLSGGAFSWLFGLSKLCRKRWGLGLGRVLFGVVRMRVGPRLRLLVSGGARLDPDVAWGLEALGWTVLSGYGLTETSPMLTFNTLDARDIETAGRAVPGVQLRIAAEPGKRDGEVQVRGPNVFKGYLDNVDDTQASFTADGWFRTNDTGYLDEKGFLHLIGRSGDLIVLADGKNIAPEEVEKVYLESPFIGEIAVLERKGLLVGILVPDEDAIRKYGAARLEELMREEIDVGSFKLPPYQRIHGYRLRREPLPRNPLGKLRRHLLGEIFDLPDDVNPSGGGRVLSDEERRFVIETENEELWAWLQKRFSDRTLTLDTSPQLDLSLDSLGWLNLTLEIDARFSVRLGDDAVGRITKLRHLLDEIAAARGAEGGSSRKDFEWIDPQGSWARGYDRVLRVVAHFITAVLLRMRVVGLENIPEKGPFILVVNHTSYLDPVCIYSALPSHVITRTYFAGWTGILFSSRFMRWISRAARTFPINPDQGASGAIALSVAVIKRGDALAFFPEGRVSSDGSLLAFQPGIGLLATRTDAPIIPAHLSGTCEVMPRGWLPRRFGNVRLVIGKPLDTQELRAKAPKDDGYQHIANAIHDAVLALSQSEDDRAG